MPETTSTPRGYPILLSADRAGGVWFGGATDGSGRPETVDRIDYITPAGAFVDVPFPPELYGYWPEAFAPAQGGDEWFLARREGDPTPLLGEVSPLDQITTTHIQVPAGSAVRGLTVGADGNLWMTDTQLVHHERTSAILKVTPSGKVTAYTSGLHPGHTTGTVWIGEDASFHPEYSERVIPTRVARIGANGKVTQYPEPPMCHVPFVLGYGPSYATQLLREGHCELTGIRRPPGSHSNHLIVVAQSIHAGTAVPYKSPVRLVLGPKPAPPRTCHAPRYVRVLADSPELVVWKNPIAEPDNAEGNGEGTQTYVACIPGHRAKHVFMTEEASLGFFAGPAGLHTAGHFIAFTALSVDHYNNGDNEIVVYDALRGRRVLTTAYPFGEDSSRATVPEFTVDPLGEVAWVKREAILGTVDDKLVRTGEHVVLQARYGGHVHTIEVAASNISRLSLHAHVLQWMSAGQAHSIALR